MSLKVSCSREFNLYVIYDPNIDMYLGNKSWVLKTEQAVIYSSRSIARRVIKKMDKDGLRIVRWSVIEEIVE